MKIINKVTKQIYFEGKNRNKENKAISNQAPSLLAK
jgi:hypothetical protein